MMDRQKWDVYRQLRAQLEEEVKKIQDNKRGVHMILVYAVMQRAISRVRKNIDFRVQQIKDREAEMLRLQKEAEAAAAREAEEAS